MSLTYTNGAPREGAGRQNRFCQDHSALNSEATEPTQPLFAELTGSDTCTAAGITAKGYAPAIVLCRQLLAAGLDPDSALEVYRGATLALHIRSIAAGAAMAVEDDRFGVPVFRRHRALGDGIASPVRKNGKGGAV
jgi:hypothetical protein